MEKKHEFIEKTIFLIRKLLEDNLQREATLDEMIEKRNILLKKFLK